MNAGLTNLATLKAWLLPASQRDATDFDDAILALGLGVAGQMQRHCNRVFERVVDGEFECPGDRLHVVLPCYPLEASPAIELRGDLATGYVAQNYNALVVDEALGAGLIKFAYWPGPPRSRLRFTFTGGYWWNQQEPEYVPPDPVTLEDPDLSAQPVGSTAVPRDLLLAWRMQCEHLWRLRDKLGTSIAKDPEAAGASSSDFLPDVERTLIAYRRFPG